MKINCGKRIGTRLALITLLESERIPYGVSENEDANLCVSVNHQWGDHVRRIVPQFLEHLQRLDVAVKDAV